MPRPTRGVRPEHFAGVEVTYTEVGATQYDVMPSRYRRLHRSIRLGQGKDVGRHALDALMSWQMHRQAGLDVTADHPRAIVGAIAAPGCQAVFGTHSPQPR